MYEHPITRLILEVQLYRLKTSSDLWIAGGLIMIITIGLFYRGIFSLFLFPFIMLGAVIIGKGILIRVFWRKIQRESDLIIFAMLGQPKRRNSIDATIGLKSSSPSQPKQK